MGDDYAVSGEDLSAWTLSGFWKRGWVGKVDPEVIGSTTRASTTWLLGLGSRWDCLR